MSIGRATLKLTNGTDEIDLLQARFEFKSVGFLLEDWRPQIAEWKGGGTWSQSALSEGRQLRYRVFDNVTETFRLKATDEGQDALIVDVEDVLSALEAAADYWATDWAETPWYLEARATEETNTRYAIVKAGRIPEVEDFYRQPFIQPETTCDAMMDELTLIIERGHWQDTVPGESNCLPIGASQEWCGVYPLRCDGDTQSVDLGSPAVLDNLLGGANSLTVEGWIYASGWGENNQGWICDKSSNGTVGWAVHIDNTKGLRAVAYYDVQNAISESGLDDWSASEFNAWHHFAAQFQGGNVRWYLWIDGQEVSYSLAQVGNNNPVADTAANAYLANVAAGNRGWNGMLGWIRWTRGSVYTPGVDFTPPVRCPLPGHAAIGLPRWKGVHEGDGTTIYDLSGQGNNGTAANDSWGECCSLDSFGNYSNGAQEETCTEGEVYIANKHNLAQLTHIFIEDGGVFGGNLLAGDPPYSLLPAVPAANDRAYFGVSSTVLDGGPFCSLVFDLSQAQTDIADIVWEYWNGAWVALTVQDNTDADGAMTGAAFDTTGVRSVHWNQPSDWAATTINGATCYWVRAEVQDAGTQPPIQQNRHVYTITWPYTEVQADEVGGTLPNVVRLLLRGQSDRNAANAPELYSTRVVCGLRSYTRDETDVGIGSSEFSAYLNFSDEQEAGAYIFTAAGGNYTLQNDVTAETGRKLQCLNAPVAGAQAGYFNVNAKAYFGKFHVFLRGDQTTGSAGDVEVQLRGRVGFTTAQLVTLTDWVPFPSTVAWEVLDMGNIRIPFVGDALADDFESSTTLISVYVRGNAASDFDLFTMIMIPVDEWAIDTYDATHEDSTVSIPALGRRRQTSNTLLDIDSIVKPKSHIRSMLRRYSDVTNDPYTAQTGWRVVSNGKAIAQANVRQRYWFFQMDTSTDAASIGSQPEVACSVQAWNVQRYLGARGDR